MSPSGHRFKHLASLYSRKKEVTAWMDLEGIMLSEISQSEKYEYYVMISLIVESNTIK